MRTLAGLLGAFLFCALFLSPARDRDAGFVMVDLPPNVKVIRLVDEQGRTSVMSREVFEAESPLADAVRDYLSKAFSHLDSDEKGESQS